MLPTPPLLSPAPIYDACYIREQTRKVWAVAGGADFTNRRIIEHTLLMRIIKSGWPMRVVTSDKPGVDKIVGEFCKEHNIFHTVTREGRYVDIYDVNRAVLAAKPDIVICFPGDTQVAAMVQSAIAADIPVERVLVPSVRGASEPIEDAEAVRSHPVLDLHLAADNDAGAKTVRGYLQSLLIALIEEQEGFNGKRPFGNSEWIDDLALPLITAKKVRGSICTEDEFGGVDWCNEGDLRRVLTAAIKDL